MHPGWGLKMGTLQVALADPLDPAHADEIGFASKRDVQVLVADPAEIEKAIERNYGQEESEDFSHVLQETRIRQEHRARSQL